MKKKTTMTEINILRREAEKVNMAEITVSHGTQLIKINLPTGKEVLEIQNRLDEVWIALKNKNK